MPLLAAIVALLVGSVVGTSARATPVTGAAESLAGGCYLVTGPDGAIGDGAAPYYAKAAGLGRFLFSGRDGRLLTPAGGSAVELTAPVSHRAVWAVTAEGDGYRLRGADDTALQVTLTRATGCRDFPEAELNVTGGPGASVDGAGNLRGFVDSHAHLMAEQFLSGGLHCGTPYSPLGITEALTDCPDHGPDGWPALSEHILSAPGPHDTVGWPTFRDWPRADSLTHEQTYYRWLERAWRGGMRMIHNYFVQNRVLCELYPLGDEPCDEMESVRIQHRRIHALQDYIDAQAGGRGKGFFRIVRSAQQAREVIADGKLAVTMGIEVSEPFGCRIIAGEAQCDRADIIAGLEELQALGINQAILTHKFDNALGGTRFDEDIIGTAVQTGQVISTGQTWQTEPCRTHQRDNALLAAPPGQCNVRGLTPLGEFTVEQMMQRRMIIDIDHMSVKTADRVLEIAEAADYPGVVASHTWTSADNYRRILALGGSVGLYATDAVADADSGHHGTAGGFVADWRNLRAQRSPDHFFGVGFGPDMNGLGVQAAPRPDAARDPVRYPFTAADGVTRIERQRTGVRVFDVNVDGNAHYGLLPDWVESLRIEAGPDGEAIVAELFGAAEAYVRQAERVAAYRR